MAENPLKNRIESALRSAYFPNPGDTVDVSDGDDEDIHIVIVSRQYDGHRIKEKNDLIWSVLTRELKPEEWGKVSLAVWKSPEEIKAA